MGLSLMSMLGTDYIENTAQQLYYYRDRCLAMALLFIETFPRNEECLNSHVTILRFTPNECSN
jgi:hypothetical protein